MYCEVSTWHTHFYAMLSDTESALSHCSSLLVSEHFMPVYRVGAFLRH